MAELVRSGALGRLGMILALNYTDFLYPPRRQEELDTARGGGVVFNQVSHQIEIARLIGGGKVRSVRANASILDPQRPSEGDCTAFLEFADGAAASLIYSSYDFFDSDELHGWVAEGGAPKPPGSTHGAMRRRLLSGAAAEADLQRDLGYGGRHLPPEQPHLPHFGTVIATCERGDVRLSADGLLVYGPEGVREIAVARGPGGRAMATRSMRCGRRCARVDEACMMRAGARRRSRSRSPSCAPPASAAKSLSRTRWVSNGRCVSIEPHPSLRGTKCRSNPERQKMLCRPLSGSPRRYAARDDDVDHGST